MRPYYIKYGILFIVVLIIIDLVTFFSAYYNKKEDIIPSLMVLNQAVESPLNNNDIAKVNKIIDLFQYKIILKKENDIYTSNYSLNQKERNELAKDDLANNNDSWKPLMLAGGSNYTLYYKLPSEQIWGKILDNTVYAFGLSLCLLPLMIFLFRDIYSLIDSVDYLHHYLDSTRTKLQGLKNKFTEDGTVDSTGELRKRDRKITELRNEVKNLKQEIERKKQDISRVKSNSSAIQEQLKKYQEEANPFDKELNKLRVEKHKLSKKFKSVEQELLTKKTELEKNLVKVEGLESLLNEIKQHSKIQQEELKKMKNEYIDAKTYNQLLKTKGNLELKIMEGQDEIRELEYKIELKDENINNIEKEKAEIYQKMLKQQNLAKSYELKLNESKENIQELNNKIKKLEHKNQEDQQKITQLDDKVLDLSRLVNSMKREGGKNVVQEIEDLKVALKTHQQQIKNLNRELSKREEKIKELTLDNVEMISKVKKYDEEFQSLKNALSEKEHSIESINSMLNIKENVISTLSDELASLRGEAKKKKTKNLSESELLGSKFVNESININKI